jgi:hypothetical protein
MRFRLYREYGALNSRPVFDAFEKGLKSLGHESVNTGEDVAVIWSVLWAGRMAANQRIYRECRAAGKPVIIIEVGNLFRGITWRICLENINGQGEFANDQEIDQNRPEKLGISLEAYKDTRSPEILIATQHRASLQWEGQPNMQTWAEQTIKLLRQYTDRKIVVRPHPRSPISVSLPNVVMELPKLVPGSYDDFDINYHYHCVINHNSGPAVQAAINGTPIICDYSSLAFPVSEKWEKLASLETKKELFLPPKIPFSHTFPIFQNYQHKHSHSTMDIDHAIPPTRKLVVHVFAGGFSSPQLSFFLNAINHLSPLISAHGQLKYISPPTVEYQRGREGRR